MQVLSRDLLQLHLRQQIDSILKVRCLGRIRILINSLSAKLTGRSTQLHTSEGQVSAALKLET